MPHPPHPVFYQVPISNDDDDDDKKRKKKFKKLKPKEILLHAGY